MNDLLASSFSNISASCVSNLAFFLFQVGDPLAEWTSSSISGSLHKLTLAKLQPDSLYEVEMAAKNCAGLGQPAMMTFRTGKGTALCEHKPSSNVIINHIIHYILIFM